MSSDRRYSPQVTNWGAWDQKIQSRFGFQPWPEYLRLDLATRPKGLYEIRLKRTKSGRLWLALFEVLRP